MGIRIFSLEEANGLVPDFSRRLEELRRLVAEIVKGQDRSAVLDLIGAEAEGSPEHIEYVGAKGKTEALIEEFDAKYRELQSYGCIVKDLSTGLVDFYSVREGRLIFLCWKLGERRITHWHELNAGYSGRRPISELDDPSRPPGHR